MYDYRAFFKALIGRYWIAFEILYSLIFLLVPTPPSGRAASYTDRFWTSSASTLEGPCSTGRV